MAAKAIVSLIRSDEVVSNVISMLDMLNPECQNEFHGILLQIQALLETHLHSAQGNLGIQKGKRNEIVSLYFLLVIYKKEG